MINKVFRKEGDCDCWEFIGEDNNVDELIINYVEYVSCIECMVVVIFDLCLSGERIIGYVICV